MEKSTDQMVMEDQLDAIERVLSAPMPIIGSWEQVYQNRIALVLEIVRGETHPGDVIVAPLSSIDEQVSGALAGIGALRMDSRQEVD